MGSMKGLCMAVAATLAPLLVGAAEPQVTIGLNGKDEIVKCEPPDKPVQITVSIPNSTVVVKCQEGYQFDPAVAEQTVCDTAQCKSSKKLSAVCPGASIAAWESGEEPPPKTTGATLSIKTLPVAETIFFVQCKQQGGGRAVAQACVVEVTVNKATQDQAGEGKVQVCAQPGGSITLSLPDKDSSIQFACTEGFSLSPAESKSVFKDDCKTEENLKDMTRTQATSAAGTPTRQASAASSITYTLRADKKPPRKKLCYLCEKHATTDEKTTPAENYCAIYVESGSRTNFSIVLAQWAVLLPCAVAVLPFL